MPSVNDQDLWAQTKLKQKRIWRCFAAYHSAFLLKHGIFFSKIPQALAHWGRDKMAASFQKTYSNAFSWMKMYEFCWKFHWNLFLRCKITIFQHWFRWWLGADQATSHYWIQWWLVYWCIYVSLGLTELTTPSKSCCLIGKLTTNLCRLSSPKYKLPRSYINPQNM